MQAVDAAYRAGDVAALRQALGDPSGFPNCRRPPELAVGGHRLEYAIYWSPLAFIEELIARGADPGLRTRTDDCTSPLEDAAAAGFTKASSLLQRHADET